MPANVDPVTFVIDGARKAPQIVALFKNQRNNIGSIKKLKGCRQPSRTGANDDGSLCGSRQNTNSMEKIVILKPFSPRGANL